MNLFRLAHQINQLAHACLAQHSEVTLTQAIVLDAIDQSPNQSQTAIVVRTGVDRSTVAEIIRRIEKRGLISRERSKKDARAYHLRLTAEGKKALAGLRRGLPKAEELLRQSVKGLDAVKLLKVAPPPNK